MKSRTGNGLAMGLIGLALVATGLRWLITPTDHPGAGGMRTLGVYAQVVAGIVLAVIGRGAAAQERQRLGEAYNSVAVATFWAMGGALIAGIGGHWLITPAAHPNASTWQTMLVWGQVGVGVWLTATAGRHSAALVAA